MLCQITFQHLIQGGAARDAHPSLGPISFIFIEFLAKYLPSNGFGAPTFGVGWCPLWKILGIRLLLRIRLKTF